MHYQDIFAAVVVIAIGIVFMGWLAFQAGRLNGYRAGVEEARGRTLKSQHLRGMRDGYVMALQHTAQQRDEYLRNVLLQVGAVTEADIEADRRRRRAREHALAQTSDMY